MRVIDGWAPADVLAIGALYCFPPSITLNLRRRSGGVSVGTAHLILSGRRRSGTAKFGRIVVAGGLVLEDRRKAWVHTLAGTNDDLSRFGEMHLCGIGRSREGDQKAQGQNTAHRICSNRPTPRSYVIHGPHCRNDLELIFAFKTGLCEIQIG